MAVVLGLLYVAVQATLPFLLKNMSLTYCTLLYCLILLAGAWI